MHRFHDVLYSHGVFTVMSGHGVVQRKGVVYSQGVKFPLQDSVHPSEAFLATG